MAPLKRTISPSSYEDVIRTLNSLPSSYTFTNLMKKNPSSNINSTKRLDRTKDYLIRSGLTMKQIDELSVIHVSGTKGKGSTCAFTEAILREHGFRTGFYSSPHLISVNERIRINGEPIDKTEFTKQFWHVYNTLKQGNETTSDMPSYFEFLTILMFHIFIRSNIDAAILEVGIGGEFDCTNVVNHPVCTGVCSLGIDHESILGNTIESIAFQKSGIFKPGTPAYTVQQPDEAMSVLIKRAREKNCTLNIVPPLDSYSWTNGTPNLGICSSVQPSNASLAIHLSSSWIAKCGTRINKKPHINNLCFEKVARALESCKWPGRTQILLGQTIDFYVDGAHTYESMECCTTWFQNSIPITRKEQNKYLIFNATKNRDINMLLTPLKKVGFNKAFFVPNVAGHVELLDHIDIFDPVEKQLAKCRLIAASWGESSVVAENVYEALEFIQKEANPMKKHSCKPQVLVTGSLHLVGSLLAIIDPKLNMVTDF